MYICLPFLYLLARRGMAKLFAILAACVVMVNVAGILTSHSAVRIFDYFPCFFSGIAAFMVLRHGDARRRLLPWQVWPVVVLFLLGAYIAAGGSSTPVFYAQWLMCACLGTMIPRFRDMPQGALAHAAHLIARYSYGIYLFHVPALWLAFNVWGGLGWVGSTIAFVLLTTVLSVAGYHLLESPLIELGRRLTARLSSSSRREAVGARG